MATKKAMKKAVKKPVKQTPVKKRPVSKPKLSCGVCGMVVTIDRACGCAEVHPVVCCGRPMRPR